MDLATYTFEKPSLLVRTDPKLLEEAKTRGFYCGHTKYNKLFNDLFFSGGTLNFKKELNPAFKAVALPYLKSFMQSFSPKQEEKEAISALILSELVDA
jgi:hypothetical protein